MIIPTVDRQSRMRGVLIVKNVSGSEWSHSEYSAGGFVWGAGVSYDLCDMSTPEAIQCANFTIACHVTGYATTGGSPRYISTPMAQAIADGDLQVTSKYKDDPQYFEEWVSKRGRV